MWLVDPMARTIEVRYNRDYSWVESRVFTREEEIVSRVIPELRLPVSQVF
jgi:Uma2 family endonuclease